MTIYVGNLSYQATEEDLNALFSEHGEVTSVKILKDNFTGKPRGFAFVDMADEAAGDKAIEALNDADFKDRKLVVNKARPKTGGDKPRGNRDRGFNRD